MAVWSIDLWRIDGLLCSKEIVFKFSFLFSYDLQVPVLCSAVWLLINIINCVYYLIVWGDVAVSICILFCGRTSGNQAMINVVSPPSALRQLHQIYWASCYVTESCCNHFLMKDVQIDRWLYILSTSAVVMMILWGGKQLNVPISYKLCEFLLYWHISVLSYV